MTWLGRTTVGIAMLLVAAGVAAAQDEMPGLEKIVDPFIPDGKKAPAGKARAIGADALRALPFPVRFTETIPADLKGEAVAVPFGDRSLGLKACLYVPTTYSAVRSWALLVESGWESSAAGQLEAFQPRAERQEYLLLVVEYRFPHGHRSGSLSGWSREGVKEVDVVQQPLEEIQKDMAADEKQVLALLKQIAGRYNVEPKAVGVTGFMWPGLMAYRLMLSHPNLFCCSITRTAVFDAECLPADVARARHRPFYVICGEKEPPWSMEGTQHAMDFFKQKRFTKVVMERIPKSGIDLRPEIASNYFRAAVEGALGPEQMAFYRAYSRAFRCVEGLAAMGDAAASEGTPSGDTVPEAKPKAPPTPEAAMAGLKAFGETYPKSDFKAGIAYMTARLANEKLADPKQADKLLRPFLRSPLRNDPLAVVALFYLAEKVIDHDTRGGDASRVLTAITTLRQATAEEKSHARDRRKELLKERAARKKVP